MFSQRAFDLGLGLPFLIHANQGDLEKVASKDFRTTEETMVLLTKQPPEHQTILAEAMADHFQAVTIVGPTLGVTASPWIVRAQLKEAGLTRRGNALGMAQITLYGDTGTILLPLNKKGHLPLDLLQNFISKALNIP
ncbi:uncharacterized protein LOC125499835 isoform X3 [Athalia rosae]|uniref:uncharacterized protein LOC125499835 isoform X3 n=1 Tax=Athalia rosae TaxID=37344 RepID=UPI00203462CF|nr:uncharacterized protein LOC125499835 isoform X3 [Athalia rosae]